MGRRTPLAGKWPSRPTSPLWESIGLPFGWQADDKAEVAHQARRAALGSIVTALLTQRRSLEDVEDCCASILCKHVGFDGEDNTLLDQGVR